MKFLQFLLITFSFAFEWCSSKEYPMFKQHDERWGNQRLGKGSHTIKQKGCVISSVAMILKQDGHDIDPGKLNSLLQLNNGYQGSNLIWGAISKVSQLKFIGKKYPSNIQKYINDDRMHVIGQLKSNHWVLIKNQQGNKIFVNDPGYNKEVYDKNQFQQFRVYTKLPPEIHSQPPPKVHSKSLPKILSKALPNVRSNPLPIARYKSTKKDFTFSIKQFGFLIALSFLF